MTSCAPSTDWFENTLLKMITENVPLAGKPGESNEPGMLQTMFSATPTEVAFNSSLGDSQQCDLHTRLSNFNTYN